MKLFPAPEDVFSSKVEKHRDFLLPLASYDLSKINNKWSGIIHFIQPIEPYDGVIGENTNQFHTYYCRENWIAYKVINGKYELETQFQFFQREYVKNNPNFKETFQGVTSYLNSLENDIKEHYKRTNENYHEMKDSYFNKENDYSFFTEYSSLGGEPNFGNWSACTDFPLKTTSKDDENHFIYPLNKNGDVFHYVGYLEAGEFGAGSCAQLLFYDPVEKIALSTFDWT